MIGKIGRKQQNETMEERYLSQMQQLEELQKEVRRLREQNEKQQGEQEEQEVRDWVIKCNSDCRGIWMYGIRASFGSARS